MSVRDTWEVSRDLVTVDAPALDEALAEIADELGAQKGCRLEAELHAMIGTPNGSDGAPGAVTRGEFVILDVIASQTTNSREGGSREGDPIAGDGRLARGGRWL